MGQAGGIRHPGRPPVPCPARAPPGRPPGVSRPRAANRRNRAPGPASFTQAAQRGRECRMRARSRSNSDAGRGLVLLGHPALPDRSAVAGGRRWRRQHRDNHENSFHKPAHGTWRTYHRAARGPGVLASLPKDVETDRFITVRYPSVLSQMYKHDKCQVSHSASNLIHGREPPACPNTAQKSSMRSHWSHGSITLHPAQRACASNCAFRHRQGHGQAIDGVLGLAPVGRPLPDRHRRRRQSVFDEINNLPSMKSGATASNAATSKAAARARARGKTPSRRHNLQPVPLSTRSVPSTRPPRRVPDPGVPGGHFRRLCAASSTRTRRPFPVAQLRELHVARGMASTSCPQWYCTTTPPEAGIDPWVGGRHPVILTPNFTGLANTKNFAESTTCISSSKAGTTCCSAAHIDVPVIGTLSYSARLLTARSSCPLLMVPLLAWSTSSEADYSGERRWCSSLLLLHHHRTPLTAYHRSQTKHDR